MSLYPIYIDSSVAGAQLSIGTTNTSCIVIGPLTQSGTSNVSTVINGVRIDSHKTNHNLFLSFDNNPYTLGLSNGIDNVCNTAVSNWAFTKNNMTGTHCTAVGHNTLTNNSTGSRNTAIGADALQSITTGSFNTALGNRALASATNSSANVAVGYEALGASVLNKYPNVAVGYQALQFLNDSNHGANVAVGYQSLGKLINGTGNVAIGFKADGGNQDIGGAMLGNTTGSNNIIIGNQANCQGSSNSVVIGAIANISSVALHSVVLGYGATSNYPNCIVLGKDAASTAENQIMIGTTSQTTQIGNTQIRNSGNSGTIIVSSKYTINNTIDYIGDSLKTTDDSWDTSITANSIVYGRSFSILSGNVTYEAGAGTSPLTYKNGTANGGDIVIRAGESSSKSNNGTQPQTLKGGNIYIDGGTAYCQGLSGSSVIASPGSIYLRTGTPRTGNTYYNTQTNLMTLSNSGITTTVPMTIGGNLTMGDGKNIVLQSSTGYIGPTEGSTSRHLGSITKGSFSTNTTLLDLSWNSTPSFTISPGNYILSVNIKPKPGNLSDGTFTGAHITITTGNRNTGSEKYAVYDPTTKPNLSFGNPPYLAIYSYSTVFSTTTSLTLFLNFYSDFTRTTGTVDPYLDATDGVSFMRIA